VNSVVPSSAVATLIAAAALWTAPASMRGPQGMPPIDFRREVKYSGGVPSGFPMPDHRLFDDPVNERILNAAVSGVTSAELKQAGIADADSRLAMLLKGQCLTVKDGTYRVSVPVIAGDAREAVRSIVDRAVAPVVPRDLAAVLGLGRPRCCPSAFRRGAGAPHSSRAAGGDRPCLPWQSMWAPVRRASGRQIRR
jgi:hypothetical protein